MFNDIRIRTADGNLSPVPASDDSISGLICYLKALPAALAKNKATQFTAAFKSLDEAELAGIKSTGDTSVIYYHVAEFFRLAPGATLYLHLLKDEPFDAQFHALNTLQRYADGSLRQAAIYTPTQALTTAIIANLQQRAKELSQTHMPLSVLIAPKLTSAEIPNLPDLTQLESPKVSILIGQDGNGLGHSLKSEAYPSISCIGALLGSVAKAKVSESIAWVEKNNVVTTAYPRQNHQELSTPALSDGTLIKNILPSQLETLHDKGYIFLKKHVGIKGSYYNDAHSAAPNSSDFHTIYANRTIDKVARVIRTALLPFIAAPVKVDEKGHIEAGVIKFWESRCELPLNALSDKGEISTYAVYINPEQNILSTKELHISLDIVPIGVANHINIALAFALNVAS